MSEMNVSFTRRQTLAAAAGAGVSMLFSQGPGRGRLQAAAGEAGAAPPVEHLCILLMEDMGLQCGPYGDTTVPTPNLDRLAKMGCTFDAAYCTSATCSPSRSSLFTGLYPHQNGHLGLAGNPDKPDVAQWGWQLHPGTPTLTPMLHEAGFAVGRTYKLHVAPEEANPFDRVYDLAEFRDAKGLMIDGTQIASFMADFYRGFIEQGTHGRMAFYPQSLDTHRPFAWKSGGHNKPLEFPGSPYVVKTAEDDLLLPHFGPDMPRPKRLRQDVADYFNAVQRVDKVVGETLDTLEELGILDETLVVFTSDHGPPFARGKCSVYELGGHVPLIVRWPGVSRPGERQATPVSLVDFMPTVLDAAALDMPGYLPGRSWRGLLDGSERHTGEPIYAVSEFHAHMTVNTWWPSRSITDGRWKLNHHLLADTPEGEGGGVVTDNPPDLPIGLGAPVGTIAREIYQRFRNPPKYELFDLHSDPYEYHSLHDNPAAAGERDRLVAALESWQRDTADPFRNPAYLQAYTEHYRRTEQAAYRWQKENDRPFWSDPRLLDGDHSRWSRPWPKVEADLRAARNGNPPAVEVPPA